MKTVLEWYASELEMLILKHNFKKISRVEFVKAKKDLFTKAKQMESDCFVEKIILKDGYRACCGKEMTDDIADKYLKEIWLKN
jgi:hypothetical protein